MTLGTANVLRAATVAMSWAASGEGVLLPAAATVALMAAVPVTR